MSHWISPKGLTPKEKKARAALLKAKKIVVAALASRRYSTL